MKKNFQIAFALLIVAILITVSIFAYIVIVEKEDKTPLEPEPKKIIDNRISPYVNQGLILEITRIRHRGLLEKIVNFGTSWKNKPQFYFISKIDNTEYISKNVEAAGASNEDFFITWDTFHQENKIVEDTQEGQETSTVKLTIVERVSSGLLGMRSQDIMREEIEVTYDYRTGRWDGKDDSFMDDDGYGHYLGETFEVWFNIYQTSADHDGIPYWTEVNILGTDPTIDDSKEYMDPDHDHIPTAWEWKWGYDPFTWDDHINLDPDVDGIQNIEEYQIRKYLSNPFKRDIYLEVDGMESGGLFDPPHVLFEESQQILIERFAQNGINLYIDAGWPNSEGSPQGGQLVPHVNTISQDSGMILQFYKNYFSEQRQGIFRYMLVGHNTGFCHPSVSNKYDTLAVDSSLRKLIKRLAFTPRTQRIVLAGASMHELGHSQGLGSWTFAGIDNRTIYTDKKGFLELWEGYDSVMNYHYIFDKHLLDYSDGDDGPPYDQNDWSILYLPTFEMDAEVIEGPLFADLDSFEDKKAAIVVKEKELTSEDWEYDEHLTMKFTESMANKKSIYTGDCEWFILVKTNKELETINRDVRVYIKPKIEPVISTWSLCYEGKLMQNQEIEMYSQQSIIDEVMSDISQES